MLSGASTAALAAMTSLKVAVAVTFFCGFGAGVAWVTIFTLLQERTEDRLRGRTFATLYTVVRLCLLISLTISPLWADFWDWVTEKLLTDQAVSIGPYTYSFAGVRIALWGGGLITAVAGAVAWRSIRRAEREAEATGEPVVPEHGPIQSFRPLGLVEPSPVAEPIEDAPTENAPREDPSVEEVGDTGAVPTADAPTEDDATDREAPEAGAAP